MPGTCAAIKEELNWWSISYSCNIFHLLFLRITNHLCYFCCVISDVMMNNSCLRKKACFQCFCEGRERNSKKFKSCFCKKPWINKNFHFSKQTNASLSFLMPFRKWKRKIFVFLGRGRLEAHMYHVTSKSIHEKNLRKKTFLNFLSRMFTDFWRKLFIFHRNN